MSRRLNIFDQRVYPTKNAYKVKSVLVEIMLLFNYLKLLDDRAIFPVKIVQFL